MTLRPCLCVQSFNFRPFPIPTTLTFFRKKLSDQNLGKSGKTTFQVNSIVYKGTALLERCGPNGTESAFVNEFGAQTEFVGSPAGHRHVLHQCVKECSLFRTDFAPMNGFLAPARRQYAPGERLQFLCSEGYVAEMPVSVGGVLKGYRLSNAHTLECSLNGTWHLVSEAEAITSNTSE